MEISDQIKNKFIRKYSDTDEYNNRIERELKLIIDKKFVDYILRICDILDLVKDIPHIIRGSSGSSLICYLLGITDIDPIKENIAFSRFLNEYRTSMPDIDMDFPHNKRDGVFESIFEKWDNVVRISNHVTYGQKGATRKALKELGVKGKVPKEKCNINYFKDKDKKMELINKINEYRVNSVY
jgi:DNA polymerase-3 subunit alpha